MAPRRPFIAQQRHIHKERAMNFLNTHTATQPRTMRLRAPTHELAADRAAERAAELALVAIETSPAQAAADEDEFSRCGWFDSSLELAAGLQVIEHLDSLPEGLPLQPAH
jgi:hypothetical protein